MKRKRKSKNYLKGIFILFLIALVFHMVIPNKKTKVQNEKRKELEEQLDDTVTEDYLPGTYITKDGKVFAIEVEDEDVLNINVTLANLFKGRDWSFCTVVFPDTGWAEEYAELDLGDQSIELVNCGIKYTYELDKKDLKLTNSDGEIFKCVKISDEYNADVVIDPYQVKMDDIVGTCEVDDLAIQVEKNDENSFNAYWIELGDTGYQVSAMAENVPLNALIEKEGIVLLGNDSCDVRLVSFLNRGLLEFESAKRGTKDGALEKNGNSYELTDLKEEFKKNHADMNYEYASYSDKIAILSEAGNNFAFNLDWYQTYTHFTCFDLFLDLQELDDGTVKILLDGTEFTSFDAEEYEIQEDIFHVTYTCENGMMFDFYPAFEDSDVEYGNVLYIPEMRFYEEIYSESGEDCGMNFIHLENTDATDQDMTTAEDFDGIELDEQEATDVDVDDSLETDPAVWFITYNSFYREEGSGDIEINVMNDAVMFVQCTDYEGNTAEWEMNLQASEIGDEGEYIYYGTDAELTYYPYDHHIHIDGEVNYSGDYYPYD